MAFLIAAMFLVPLAPFGFAGAPSAIARESVSNNEPGADDVDYNFTFEAGGTDANLHVTFPSGFGLVGATLGDTDFPGTEAGAVLGQSINITNANLVDGTTYYMNINDVDLPRDSGTFALTITHYTSTWTANGSASANVLNIPAISLGIELDEDHLDEGADDTVLGSGAVTDYWFEVTWNNAYAHATDSVNITFPDEFDLSAASVTNGAIDDDEAGYNIQATDDDAATFTVRVQDVENPKVTTDTAYSFSAEIRDDDQDVIASSTFVVTIIPTEIVARHTGADTVIEEGDEEDDSITVELETRPDDDVTVELDFGDEITGDKDELTFTTSNWNVQQSVKLTAVDDTKVEGTKSESIKLTSQSDDANYDGLEDTITVTILDNDEGLVLRHTDSKTQVVEGSSTADTYEVVLATEPTKIVTVTIEPNSKLTVDEDELTFTASNWNTPKVIEVKSARMDDNDYQKPEKVTILHTTVSDDADYDELEEELEVTIKDDEHAALGLTDEQIADANKLVKLTVTEQDDGMFLEWELPDQEDLDDIFESDGEITIEGVQVLYSNSPYTLQATFDDGDDEFDNAEYLHTTGDGATARTKYVVTMFYDEDVGKWTADDVPDTRDDGYEGTAFEEPLLPWWAWLLIGIGIVILVLLILMAVIAGQNRKAYDDDDWDDADNGDTKAAAAAAKTDADDNGKGKKRKYDIECPVCEHHFSAKGAKPLKTECPNCGAKGTLN